MNAYHSQLLLQEIIFWQDQNSFHPQVVGLSDTGIENSSWSLKKDHALFVLKTKHNLGQYLNDISAFNFCFTL